MIRKLFIAVSPFVAVVILAAGIASRAQVKRIVLADNATRWVFLEVGAWRVSIYHLFYQPKPASLRHTLRFGAAIQNAHLRHKHRDRFFADESKQGPRSGYRFIAFGLWITLAIALTGPVLLIASRFGRRRWRRRRGLCLFCAYDLTGNVTGVCPECGRAVT